MPFLVFCVCLFSISHDISCFFLQSRPPFHHPRTLPFVRDAVFTLATGLHKILEKKRRGELKVNGTHLREVMQQNGFADGITGPITFQSEIPDRETVRMSYILFNFQKVGFSRAGSIATGNASSFKDCEQYRKDYGAPSLKDECKAIVFRGSCSNLFVGQAFVAVVFFTRAFRVCLPLLF